MRQNQLVVHPAGHGNGRGNNGTPNYKNGSAAHARGQAFNIDAEEAKDQPATVMGTLLVNSVLATVLFDSGHRIHSCRKHLHFRITSSMKR